MIIFTYKQYNNNIIIMIINTQHFTYTLEKDPYESDDIFYDRFWFIVSQQPKNKTEFKKYLDYSYIYVHIRHHNVTYEPYIMENIEKYSKNLHKEISI